jgi:hypothetical protein
LEGKLKEGDFQSLRGLKSAQDLKAFDADVVTNVLDTQHLPFVCEPVVSVTNKADRNKAFHQL